MEPMEELWMKVSKRFKDGNRYIALEGVNDLSFLYVSGFVDVKKFPFKDWIEAFKDSRQSTGKYIVNHEQWLAKKKFRFTGPIGVPFDPMTIPEKAYTEKEIIDLLSKKIIPNTTYDPSYIPQVMNNLRAQNKFVNGKFIIDRKTKEYVNQIVNTYPSPTRILELMVGAIKWNKKSKHQRAGLEAQKSSFAAGSTAQRIAEQRLAEIAKEIHAHTPVEPKGPTISLKDLQKRRGPGGRI